MDHPAIDATPYPLREALMPPLPPPHPIDCCVWCPPTPKNAPPDLHKPYCPNYRRDPRRHNVNLVEHAPQNLLRWVVVGLLLAAIVPLAIWRWNHEAVRLYDAPPIHVKGWF